MPRRKKLVDDLFLAIAEHNWCSCHAHCFRILYGLPADWQIKLASFMAHRYLPIFENKSPDTKWPRILLDDLAKWVSEFGKILPRRQEKSQSANSSQYSHQENIQFFSSLRGLVNAHYHQDEPFILTSACVYTLMLAIAAHGSYAWSADNPEAQKMSNNNTDISPLHGSVFDNVAAMTLEEREWRQVAEWLNTEEVWNYPDEVDIKEMEQLLADWKSDEMLLLGGQSFKLLKGKKPKYDLSVSDITNRFKELGFI